jgi:capsular polysaccharide biosynthesis protein
MNKFMVQKENDLDFRNLFFATLRQWRFIIIFSFCMMILLGGLSFLKGRKTLANETAVSQNNSQYQSQIDAYNLSVSNLNSQLSTLQDQIKQKQHEKDFRYLYSIDPYNAEQLTHIYTINIPKNDDGSLKADISTVLGGIDATIGNADLQSSLLPSRTNQTEDDSLNATIIRSSNNTLKAFTVLILAATEDDANAIDAAVDQLLTDKLPDMQKQYGEFTLTTQDKSAKITSSDVIQNLNDNYTQALTNLQSSLSSISKQLDDLKYPEGSFINASSIKKAAIKRAIIGLILGLVLSVFFIILWFLSKDTITGVDEFSKKTNINLLGFMPRTVSKLPGKHIDAWINRMDEGTTEKDRDKTLHAIAAQIEALIPANASPKILLLNTHTSTAAEELTEGLKALNPNRFIGAGTLLDDPETVKLTKETGTVILLETRGKSRYSIFAQELNLLNVMDVKILGTILL